MRRYLEVGRRGFRRYATYRAATVAGAFTNTVFALIQASVMIAVYTQRDEIGGFDRTDALTYVFVTQAMLMMVGAFAGGGELAERVASGDVVTDLYRPIDFQGYWLSLDLGRAAFQAMARGIPPFAAGVVFFTLVIPDFPTFAAYVVSCVLATTVGFGVRFLMGLSAFWLIDARGATQLAQTVMLFFSGFIVPTNFFPGWLEQIANLLPFVAIVQLPVEVFLGKHTGSGLAALFAVQLVWALVLLLVGRGVLALATRRVVIQGG